MDEAPSRQLDKFIIRLPEGMRDQIKAASKSSKRTMNAEVVARLDASFKADENAKGLAFVKAAKGLATSAGSNGTIDDRLTAIENQLVALNEKLAGQA